eukprot:2265248-Rhodomonas_salina.2
MILRARYGTSGTESDMARVGPYETAMECLVLNGTIRGRVGGFYRALLPVRVCDCSLDVSPVLATTLLTPCLAMPGTAICYLRA